MRGDLNNELKKFKGVRSSLQFNLRVMSLIKLIWLFTKNILVKAERSLLVNIKFQLFNFHLLNQTFIIVFRTYHMYAFNNKFTQRLFVEWV